MEQQTTEKPGKILFVNKKTYFFWLFVATFINCLGGLVRGFRHHENWLIIISIFSLTMIVIGSFLLWRKVYKENNHR
jgi:predicted permease